EGNPTSKTHLRNTLIANNTGSPLARGNPLPGNCNPAQGLDPAGTGNLNGFVNEGGNLQFPGGLLFPDATCATAIATAPAQPISSPVATENETFPLTGLGGAIDGGTLIGCPLKDQLGLPRPLDG